jgi:hypothetical protein
MIKLYGVKAVFGDRKNLVDISTLVPNEKISGMKNVSS